LTPVPEQGSTTTIGVALETDFASVPGWFSWENAGCGAAVADINGDGRLDLVVLAVDQVAGGPNTGSYRVGFGTDDEVTVGEWSAWMSIPGWFSWQNEGAGLVVADVDGDGLLDLVVVMVDAPDGPNVGYYRVGRALDATGAVTKGWTDWAPIPDWFSWTNAGADIAVADVDGDGRLDLVVLMVDAPDGPNAGYYRSGPLGVGGVVTGWRDWVAVPDWRFWENQGAGIAVADLDGDGTAELVVLAVDNPVGQNGGYYSVGWRLDGRGRPADGWGPWQPVPQWRFWENQDAALAVAKLGPRGAPHLVVLAVDNPPGANDGWYRVLDPMTDLDMAAEMGVWRLLEDDSQVLAVHAALLRTGDVVFFAGSSNDPDRHAAHQYGTAVWHYPGPRFSRPDTAVDLFCCGHAFLPDGRLLAAGGTGQYDPFFGLKQAVAFDPFEGAPDPGSPTGAAGAWTAAPDMTGGRWYPTLLPLADGRVLAVSGLDEKNELNVVPETYLDGSWTSLSPSPHWPMYAHLFLLQDGRVFYSGGQYGANNGVRPTIWDPATNASTDLQGVLPDPQARNQSASVLLPPAQDQRVMIMGGGPFDMHDQTGAVASVAIADLAAPQPAYRSVAGLNMARMHLCATLLPDRTVLVSGGAMMEENAAQAAFAAEIYHPDPGAGPGRWAMAAESRVPRLYHSVAVLMPDGKVITAGSNPQRKTEELRIEVFWPPYLFETTRPEITVADTELGYGGAVAVTVPDAAGLASACLVQAGATTHSSNCEQRLVDLPLTVTGANTASLALPVTATLAPPAWYLLFVVNAEGIPSHGIWVHLS
jgi:hypothetical protein